MAGRTTLWAVIRNCVPEGMRRMFFKIGQRRTSGARRDGLTLTFRKLSCSFQKLGVPISELRWQRSQE